MNGFAVIDKKSGMSSSDVVIKCRNSLSKSIGQKIKCGHMGTLDPMAEGVLLVAFGNTTRLFDFLLAKQKSYTATFTFGEERDTVDRAGKIIATSHLPKFQNLQEVLPKFVGNISQVPPKFSAVNVNGERAYNMARRGKTFELKAKQVFIQNISVIDKTLDGDLCKDVTLSITCGGGTYIRSICTDIANSLGVCAYMSSLTRTECGGFTLKDSVTVNDFIATPQKFTLDVRYLVEKIMPIITPDDTTYLYIKNGRSIDCNLDDGYYGFEYNSKVCFIVKVRDKKAKSVCYLQENGNFSL